MASAEEKPEEIAGGSCMICKEEFDTNQELAQHLIGHSEDDYWKKRVQELEENTKAKTPNNNAYFMNSNRGPEFISTSFVKETRRRPAATAAAVQKEPEVVDLAGSDDEASAQESHSSKKVRVSNTVRPASRTVPKNLSSESPFKCHTCNISGFNNATEFNAHLLTHGKSRPFKCHICIKYFTSKGACSQHLQMHVRNPTHKCRFCDKMFTMKGVLRKHEERHQLQNIQKNK